MRDGDNLFEHLSLGQVFSRSTNVFIDRFDLFMTLSAVVVVPAALVGAFLGAMLGLEMVMHPDDPEAQFKDISEFMSQHAGGLAFAAIAHVCLSTFITLVGEGGMVRACADIYAEQPQGWFTVVKLSAQNFCTLLLSSLICGGICALGGLFLYILFIFAVVNHSGFLGFLVIVCGIIYLLGLIYFISSTRFIFPMIMVENKGPINAIRRSFEISEGRRAYIFCAVFILWTGKVIVSQLLHNIFSSGNPMAAFLTPFGIIISFVPDLIYLPINSILKTVLYASVRVDKEGLTQAVLKRELVEPTIYTAPSTDYRQVSLMEDNGDSVTKSMVSDFA
mmetsp:Transcript_1455/g.1996  ORF Transcript_1455/g.1996 Transcript_1455/m.1996 type:complete len:334 (-) Transcript_1455:240-1241(-)|eukprot:CAMPEP_0198145170 /NCGR_PEP_ID=MMETSP1443-20131203/21479_1 /TAXON_ID=186043 /ORGANISM="Entomoneis sp., Strain CCMP2396" /LENGTH=333 /DNA_ID=CAMNT_0043808725 /DNA_START=231 /DNA_END=1232 /DNA_ORIENTATION=+